MHLRSAAGSATAATAHSGAGGGMRFFWAALVAALASSQLEAAVVSSRVEVHGSRGLLARRHVPLAEEEPASDSLAAAAHGQAEASGATAAHAKENHRHQRHGSSTMLNASWEEAAPGLLLALFAGVATSFGAIALPLLPPGGPPPCTMAFAMTLAAGVMITVAGEMIWPALQTGSWWHAFLFTASALICLGCCWLGDLVDAHHHGHLHGAAQAGSACAADVGDKIQKGNTQEARSRRLALLLFFSLTAHNLPEGFAVAVSTISGRWFGISVCIAVALHNIPEGLTLAVATYDWTKSRWKAFLVPTVAGLAEPLGAVLAMSLFGEYITHSLIDDLMVSVAGIMFCIALAELLPEAAATKCWRCSICGFLCGMLVMYLTHQVIDHASGGHGGHGHSHSHTLSALLERAERQAALGLPMESL